MRRVHGVTVGISLLSNALKNWEGKSILSGLMSVDGIEEKLGGREVKVD
nr:hypothetical protein [Candidatus Freyarchaeota archaeon]